MEIKVSIELNGSFDEQMQQDLATADITIKSLPISNKDLIGKQLENLIWDQYQAALRFAFRAEKLDGNLVRIASDNRQHTD